MNWTLTWLIPASVASQAAAYSVMIELITRAAGARLANCFAADLSAGDATMETKMRRYFVLHQLLPAQNDRVV